MFGSHHNVIHTIFVSFALLCLVNVAHADLLVDYQREYDYSISYDDATQQLESKTYPIKPLPEEVPEGLSLQEAIFLALRFNPNIQNTEIDRILQKFDLRVRQNEYELHYALEGGTNYSRFTTDGVPQPPTTFTDINASVSLDQSAYGTRYSLAYDQGFDGHSYNPAFRFDITQPLLRGAGREVNLANLNLALEQEAINKLNIKSTIISVVSQVIITYRAYVSILENTEIQERNLNNAEETLERLRAEVRVGRKAPADLLDQEVNVEDFRLQFINFQNGLDAARLSLLEIIGLDPDTEIYPTDKIDIKNFDIPEVEETTQLALNYNIGYQVQWINFVDVERQIIIQENQQLWDLTANFSLASGGTNINSLIDDNRQTFNLRFSVPINDLPRKQGLLRAKGSYEQAKIDLDTSERGIRTDVKNFIRDLKNDKASIDIQEKRIEIARRNYQTKLKEQEVGRTTSFEVASVQNELLQAELSLTNAKETYLNRVLALHDFLGITLDVWGVEIRY